MKFDQIVRNGPGIYHAGWGVLSDLPALLEGFNRIAIVSGKKSWAAFQKHFPNCPWRVYTYDESASYENMEAIAERIQNADLIIGVGGGKVLDTSKGVAERLNADIAFIPTVAGTCACATPVAAVYHPDHTFREIAYFRRSGVLCLVDYQLLLESPRAYFLGGISDTLAKWYEIEALTRKYQIYRAPVALARAAASVTREVLLRDTQTAIAALEAQQKDEAFARVIDCIFTVAAQVGCYGCDDGRTAGAHAIHNALTIYPETHPIQHGIKVAYGILVQLVTTGDEEEVRRLLPYYRENGFIYRFEQLGIQDAIEVAAPRIAEFAARPEQSFQLIRPITAEEIAQAMLRLEALVA